MTHADPADPFSGPDPLDVIAEHKARADQANLDADAWEAEQGWHGTPTDEVRIVVADPLRAAIDHADAVISVALPKVYIPGPAEGHEEEFVRVRTGQFTRRVLSCIPSDVLYRRGDLVGTIEGTRGAKRWVVLTNERARHIIDDHVRLQKNVVRQKGSVDVDVPCSDDHARLVIDAATCSPDIRELRLLTHCPVFTAGWALSPPGFAAGIFYDEPAELEDLAPAEDNAALDDLVIDFPFKDASSRANLIGLLVTCLVRPAIDGNVPLHLVMSSLERTGKTKLIEDVVGGIILGAPVPAVQMQGTDEERDKRILAMLLAGTTLAHLDNLRDFLDSAALASIVTSSVYNGRLLGSSRMATLPNTLILVASGNNVRATGEIVKRTVPIVLQPATDSPETRDDFHHQDLRAHVRAIRRRVLGALIWKVQNRSGASLARMGGFEAWAAVVGSTLGRPWMDNASEWRSEHDPEGDDLKRFVEEWWKRLRSDYAPPKDLLAIADELDLFGPLLQRATGDRGRLTTFCMRVLSRNVSRPVGIFRIARLRVGNASAWRLVNGSEGSEGL